MIIYDNKIHPGSFLGGGLRHVGLEATAGPTSLPLPSLRFVFPSSSFSLQLPPSTLTVSCISPFMTALKPSAAALEGMH